MSSERPRKEKVARSVLWAASVLPGAPKRLAPRRVTAAWHRGVARGAGGARVCAPACAAVPPSPSLILHHGELLTVRYRALRRRRADRAAP